MRRYDLAIVGGGTAGLIAAQTAVGLGARTILVERAEQTGGDCLWYGCVPSKSLIAAAELAHRMRSAGSVGLAPVEPEIDFARVMAHVHGARRTIEPQDSADRLRSLGVEVMHGQAVFLAPGRLAVDGRPIAYRTALVATGSMPIVPALDGLGEADPLTNETVWDLTELPRRLVVLGAGPIGCELGQAFARLGSRVTMVQRADRVLTKEEPEASDLLGERLAAEGIDLRLSTSAVAIRRSGGTQTLEIEREPGPGDAGGAPEPIEFDRILVAAGRRPDTDGLGLEAIGVERDSRGAVKVDDRLRTTARNVYAAGDATGAMPFTHVAGYHGRTVVANALFHARARVFYDAVPWCTFTDPEVAHVGLTEAQARERFGDGAAICMYQYADLDRAITAGQAYGFAKLVGDDRGRLVGATVAAPAGGEAIAELTAWVSRRAPIGDVSTTVHAYPTFAEGPARAADDHLRAKWLTPRVRSATRPVLALLRALERPAR